MCAPPWPAPLLRRAADAHDDALTRPPKPGNEREIAEMILNGIVARAKSRFD
jgi:hypothetical protein